MAHPSTSTRARTMLLGMLLVLLVPSSVAAGRPDGVDPSIAQPPLNDSFGPWECWSTGAGITCQGERSLSWTNEPTFLECDGRRVYATGTDVATLTRHGDPDGLALWSRQHIAIEETWTLQPDGSGPAVRAYGRMSQTYDYGVPGDISTRTQRYNGVDVQVTAPSVGLIVHDNGIKVFDIEDNIVLAHGPHPLLVDFGAAFDRVCDAFDELGA